MLLVTCIQGTLSLDLVPSDKFYLLEIVFSGYPTVTQLTDAVCSNRIIAKQIYQISFAQFINPDT